MEKPDEYFEVNLTATNELIDIAKRNHIKKFIFSSTAAVYGSPDTMEPCLKMASSSHISYGDSKYQAESQDHFLYQSARKLWHVTSLLQCGRNCSERVA
jgi:UDP-glucose 4-epimerase